jgi:sodium-dependent dicarboxylate transporter 2/3/5
MTGMNRQYLLTIILTVLILILFSVSPCPEGLTREGLKALGIFLVAIVLWVSSAIPLSVTGLLIMVLLPVLGVMESERAFSLFGNRAVFFILGAFILAAAMMKTGLSRRLSLLFLSRFDSSPRRLLLGILVTCTLMAFIMPEHAVAAIMFPVVTVIASGLRLKPGESQYGIQLYLCMAWGAIIGGVATFLGGARNPLAIALLDEHYGLSISFFEWIIAAVPITIAMLVFAVGVLVVAFRIDIDDVAPAREVLAGQLRDAGRMTFVEKKVTMILSATIIAWIFFSEELGLASISLLSAVLLFVFKTIEWKDVESYVNWGVILMYGGAISIGSALVETNAASWVSHQIMQNIVLSPFLFLLLVSLIAKFLTEGISNAACVSILLPIVFEIGDIYAINPIATVLIVAIPSGLAFVLPMGTPPNAIAYSSGYYEIRDIMVPALILNIVSWIIFVIMALIYWPLVGINLI